MDILCRKMVHLTYLMQKSRRCVYRNTCTMIPLLYKRLDRPRKKKITKRRLYVFGTIDMLLIYRLDTYKEDTLMVSLRKNRMCLSPLSLPWKESFVITCGMRYMICMDRRSVREGVTILRRNRISRLVNIGIGMGTNFVTRRFLRLITLVSFGKFSR